ncbi:MAG: hypothetical protein JSV49_06285 [Thermoplasmata archaeon]|nr:MAG: hypothetical protein JSV49_06285 [Thermoplasmata archaeon]
MAVELGWYLAPPFIAGFVSAALGSYVIYKHPKDTSSHVFFILMIALSIWMFGEFAMQVSGTVSQAQMFGKLSNLGYILMPVALLHFTLVYPTLAIPKDKGSIYLAGLYVPTILMILLLLSTNVFFTVDTGEKIYGPDIFVDGDGRDSYDRGIVDGPNGTFKQLMADDEEKEKWEFYDLDGDLYFDTTRNASETLVWGNYIIIGRAGENESTKTKLLEATNSYRLYWLDNITEGAEGIGAYDSGEDIYYNSNGYKGIQTENETLIKFGEGNYIYLQGNMYIIFILFFLSFIIVAILNILNRLMKAEDPKERAQMSYLSAGLIFILFFILSYYFVGAFVSVRVLDGILTITMALFFAIAVLKYNLMDIELIIKKSLFYSIIFIMIALIFVVIGEGMEYFIGTVLMLGSGLMPNIVAAFIVAIVFIPLTKQVKRFTDWIFPEARKYEKEYIDRMSAYEATFDAMMADGKISGKEKEALHILREKLEISEEEHRELEKKIRAASNI